MSPEYGSPIEILLVEDNAGDIRLTREALSEAKVANNLAVARDGIEALEYLRQEGGNADAPVESTPGIGSKFTLSLPLESPEVIIAT